MCSLLKKKTVGHLSSGHDVYLQELPMRGASSNGASAKSWVEELVDIRKFSVFLSQPQKAEMPLRLESRTNKLSSCERSTWHHAY